MKKIIKIVFVVIVSIPLLVVGGIVIFLPNVKLQKDLFIEVTPERIARGSYLANHVTVCVDCHSTRDWTKYSGPITPGTEGKGGEVFDQKFGFPGAFYAANITQYNLKTWSDAELFRAITSGVGRDNHPFFPVMPFKNYGRLDKEDILSIIAYVKTMPPIESKIPAGKPDFPMGIIMKTFPVEANLRKKPDSSNTVAYGKYLVTAAACFDCHTDVDDKANPLPGMDYAGGRTFPMPFGILKSTNITFDETTGIGKWTKEEFINRFKSNDPNVKPPASVKANEFNTIMPWTMYAGMTEEDMGAIYEFLKTVKPVVNQVVRFSANK